VQEENFVPKREPRENEREKEAVRGAEISGADRSTKVETQAPEPEFPVTPLTIWIDKKEAYRIYDRFDESELEQLPDGNFLAHCAYPLDEWVYSLILWFGPSAKVLEPKFIRDEVIRRIRKMSEQYGLGGQ